MKTLMASSVLLVVFVPLSIAGLACSGSSAGTMPDAPGSTVNDDPTRPPSSGEPASQSSTSVDSPPAPPPIEPIVELPNGVEERRIMQAVAPEHLSELNRLVGRYARGDASASVYEGTFSARDNMGSLGPTYQNGVMTDGTAVTASIAWEEKIYWNGQHVPGWALSIRSATHRIRLAQSAKAPSPNETALSLVAPNKSPWGLTGTCAGCVAAFAPTASTLVIANDIVANGKWGDSRPLTVTARGSLTRVPIDKLTFEHLIAIADPYMDGTTMHSFAKTAAGDEMVRGGVASTFKEPAPVPATGKNFYASEKISSYRLDWFVDQKKLARYGLRNMSITSTESCCSEGPPGACMPRVCF